MSAKEKVKVRAVLDHYLETNHHRRTPERYAILDAVYSIGGHFTLEELGRLLEKRNFRVSRATLYNTIHLFIELRLVVRHSLVDGTKYEACFDNGSHIHEVCTVCGRVTEIEAPLIAKALDETELCAFRRDAFALYIYGVCASCQSERTNMDDKEKE